MPPQPPGPSGAPPPPEQAPWLLRLMGLAILAAVGILAFAKIRQLIPPHIEGVVITSNDDRLQICTRSPLHGCVIRWGYQFGRDHTAVISPLVTIDPVPSCDSMTSAAYDACINTGEPYSATSQMWHACIAAHGVLYRRDSPYVVDLDPRSTDQMLQPGQFQMRCDEGEIDGRFNDGR